ncbi:catechol 2,3-dioxygenase-like lactoylglutathione lyase family enzyme [Nocardia transvalensis]|uniref:Catechol 2,3-dioxygenase-like lactoylglutathione lyase family enzyme n=1 Tax=Nocardia transvalensis TaxID=37333 RepID=A0A7W9UGR8_9NOCA|nr:VOC family protein [Nocardia transvalensis]MBB5912574.1 catechol 2,3-dioxygenase-like lactoylglutathione lyase family enzyme [Nocardia transvalensis]
MDIRRVVPDLRPADMERTRAFYRQLGFEEVMDLGWIVTLASPSNPTAQILLIGANAEGPQPDISVEVDDVDAAHDTMAAAGAEIVYTLRDEPWGVRRFFVRDPDGTVVNVVSHR